MKQQLTLSFVLSETNILLGMKKRGFGAGKWNGFGGKVRAGESLEAAACRELHEEANLTATKLTQAGTLGFVYEDLPDALDVSVFRVESYLGSPAESEEMRPQWFRIADIPYADMWADDAFWLPLFLDRIKFKGMFVFDRTGTIRTHELVRI